MYHREAPLTLEGRAVWEGFQDIAWRVRVGGMSYIAGVETAGLVSRLERDGISRDIAEDLVAACEQSFVKAMNEKDDEGGSDKD